MGNLSLTFIGRCAAIICMHVCACLTTLVTHVPPSFSPSLALLLSLTHSLALHSLNFMPKQWHAINLNGFALRLKQNASTNPRNVFSAPEACVCESECCTTLPAGLSKHLIRQAPTHLLSLTPPPALPCSFSLVVENVLKFYILFPFLFFFFFFVALKCLLTLEIYATFSNTCSSKFLL